MISDDGGRLDRRRGRDVADRLGGEGQEQGISVCAYADVRCH